MEPREYIAIHPTQAATFDTRQLRESFLVENLFTPGQIALAYTHYDRLLIGGVMPSAAPIELPNPAVLRADFFLQRRELGVLNIGGQGRVVVDGTVHELAKCDCLYVGRSNKQVRFESADAADPAAFYLVSAPAHADYPTQKKTLAEADPVELGSQATANRRTVYKFIHLAGIKSCQLVMGMTRLEEGSIWNTMPTHTHNRRSEIYLYFDVEAGKRVIHLHGEPTQTRHLVMGDRQAVLSPPWSIHSGAGMSAYAFIWAMAGENLEYTDMDPVDIEKLA